MLTGVETLIGFSANSEEVLWLRLLPKANLGLFFGLNQSAFFAGDFLGGIVNGYLYLHFGLSSCIQVVLAVMLLNSALFAGLLYRGGAAQNRRPEMAVA